MTRALVVALLALLLGSCTRAPTAVTFHADGYPEKLSDWGLFAIADGRVAPRASVVGYDLATPLFSDHAQKWRTVWMPKGTSGRVRGDDTIDFPVGTIVSKTFYYPVPAGTAAPQDSRVVLNVAQRTGIAALSERDVRLVETRLLVHRAGGWVAIPYVWDADGRDATLARTGAEIPLTLRDGDGTTRDFTYTVPNQNQCAGCHAQDYRTRALAPIGLKPRHLMHGGDTSAIALLTRAGYLTGSIAGIAANADWRDPNASVAARARAYLDINCSHCHNAVGAARTSGLWLDAKTVDPRVLGMCKPPVAAGRGTGDRPFDVVPGHPETSILPYRMESTDPGAMMPEVGRALVHREGLDLVVRYITTLKGACEKVGT